VIANNADKKHRKAIKKKQILNDLEESVNWLKLHQAGKVEAKSLEQVLNEL
jgi:hypothetical protein